MPSRPRPASRIQNPGSYIAGRVIPCADPKAQYLSHKPAIDAAIHAVLDGGRYILGDAVRAFESEFASYIGVTHGVGVGSGTEALHLALSACGVGPGDEVVTVSHTAVATVAAIELCHARPRWVDIEPRYYTLDPRRLAKAIGRRTKAVIPVHLYGQPADLAPILALARKKGIRVIEDCAQAHGALYEGRKAGSFGDIGCFSFYPTKNLGAIGDGGMMVTRDSSLAEKARRLREYGWVERHVSQIPGWNTRMDELQAAILRVKLRTLDQDNAKRSRLAARYNQGLRGTGLVLPDTRPGSSHAFHLYAVRSRERDALRKHLRSRNVDAGIHYPVPVHLMPAYSKRFMPAASLPETESAAREVLSLPMYPELGEANVDRVVEAVRAFRRT